MDKDASITADNRSKPVIPGSFEQAAIPAIKKSARKNAKDKFLFTT